MKYKLAAIRPQIKDCSSHHPLTMISSPVMSRRRWNFPFFFRHFLFQVSDGRSPLCTISLFLPEPSSGQPERKRHSLDSFWIRSSFVFYDLSRGKYFKWWRWLLRWKKRESWKDAVGNWVGSEWLKGGRKEGWMEGHMLWTQKEREEVPKLVLSKEKTFELKERKGGEEEMKCNCGSWLRWATSVLVE